MRGRGALGVIGLVAGALALTACGTTVAGAPTAGARLTGVTLSTELPTSTQSSATTSAPATTTSSTSTTSSTADTTTTSETTTSRSWKLPAPQTSATTNSFGDVLAKKGAVYALVDVDSREQLIAFTVDSVTLDPKCSATGASKPANGHFVEIVMRIEVRNSTPQRLSDAGVEFQAHNWTAFDPKGTAQVDSDSTAAGSCLAPTQQMPYATDFSADGVTTGRIVLDVASAKGTLVLTTAGITDGGWEYAY